MYKKKERPRAGGGMLSWQTRKKKLSKVWLETKKMMGKNYNLLSLKGLPKACKVPKNLSNFVDFFKPNYYT